mgnify:CR=1 FL=1
MDIFKIIGVGLIGGILSMTVKQYKKEYALLVALATVTVILFFTLDTLETAISQISLITEKSGVIFYGSYESGRCGIYNAVRSGNIA